MDISIQKRKFEDDTETVSSEQYLENEDRSSISLVNYAEKLGHYLSNEYELLVRTLSYLNLNDLCNAALVSKTWYSASKSILKKRESRNKFRWHVKIAKYNCSLHNLMHEIVCRSQLTLYLQRTLRKNFSLRHRIPGLFGKFLVLSCDDLDIPVYESDNSFEYYEKATCAIYFPLTENFHVETVSAWKFSSHVDVNTLKGILIFSSHMSKFSNYSADISRYKNSVPIAGGIFPDLYNNLPESGTYFIFLSGSKVTCYSNVLIEKNSRDIEVFIKNMKDDLGEINVKCKQRIAFVFQCCGRRTIELERKIYRKHFPNTPAFHLITNGEIGNCTEKRKTEAGANDSSFVRVVNNALEMQYTTVYFFITLNLST